MTTLAGLFELGPMIAYPLIIGLLFVISWFALEETAGVNAENLKHRG